jgi:hypothetical protein
MSNWKKALIPNFMCLPYIGLDRYPIQWSGKMSRELWPFPGRLLAIFPGTLRANTTRHQWYIFQAQKGQSFPERQPILSGSVTQISRASRRETMPRPPNQPPAQGQKRVVPNDEEYLFSCHPGLFPGLLPALLPTLRSGPVKRVRLRPQKT